MKVTVSASKIQGEVQAISETDIRKWSQKQTDYRIKIYGKPLSI